MKVIKIKSCTKCPYFSLEQPMGCNSNPGQIYEPWCFKDMPYKGVLLTWTNKHTNLITPPKTCKLEEYDEAN